MATLAKILTNAQAKAFDLPPTLTQSERVELFVFSADATAYFKGLTSPTSRLSFALQWAYFREAGKFYDPKDFHDHDLRYAIENCNIVRLKPELKSKPRLDTLKTKLGGANSTRHRQTILRLLGWREMTQLDLSSVAEQARYQAKKQIAPRDNFFYIVEYIWSRRWMMPSYTALSTIVLQANSEIEDRYLDKVEATLSDAEADELYALILDKRSNRTLLADLKHLDQATRAKSIRNNVKKHTLLKDLFFKHRKLIEDLQMSDQSVEYYAELVTRTPVNQLKQRNDRRKILWFLLCFVKVQFYRCQDIAMKGFMADMKAIKNRADKLSKELMYAQRTEHFSSVKNALDSREELMDVMNAIYQILEDSTLSDRRKNELIRNQVIDVLDIQTNVFQPKITRLELAVEQEQAQGWFYNELFKSSMAASRKWAKTIKTLVFDERYSLKPLIRAINDFCSGDTKQSLPVLLKDADRQALLERENNQNFYHLLLFLAMYDRVRSGRLNLLYSFEYRALETYLISIEEWNDRRDRLLEIAGLTQYSDVYQILSQLKSRLQDKYKEVNESILSNQNPYLQPRANGKFGVITPATDHSSAKYISTQLQSNGSLPVLQVLRDIERASPYLEKLSHLATKGVTHEPNPDTAFAGLIALGCNIGVPRMADRSYGITESELSDMVTYRFSNTNLDNINKQILAQLDKINLPKVYKVEDDRIYSSSDGKKVSVAVDSLISNYSYKYYGKGKGVALYSFIDERQGLFHTSVFSSAAREATYLADGLLNNTSNLRRVHTSDTHGYTEAVFGVMHFLGISFAPRIKGLEDQALSCFSSSQTYKKKDYRIKPTRKLDSKLIVENWENILRFMCTIKLGVSSASQLFSRLNSYAKDNPLYKAMKEFGRIGKSQHILNYYHDMQFRQRIQKQLNLVEASNKFFNAVFWDRGRKFYVASRDELEKYALCRAIIQNSIILWNYLYLTGLIKEEKDKNVRDLMVEEIAKGSILTWKHVIFTGEYDFTKRSKSGKAFNIEKLARFKLSPTLLG